jgi:hypothetical protein
VQVCDYLKSAHLHVFQFIHFNKPYSSRSLEEPIPRDELLPREEFPPPEFPRPEFPFREFPPREFPLREFPEEPDDFEEEEEEELLLPPRELPPERPEDFAIVTSF